MNLIRSRLAIDDFILEMMRLPPSQLQLAHLLDWTSQLDIKDELIRQHISFCQKNYQRRLLCRTSRFEMLILGWQAGQASSIHHHADSLNVTRVYRGVLTSRKFANSQLNPIQTHEEYLEKDGLESVERYEIHQLANTTDQNLVTLHVYARPLQNIQIYCPITGRSERIAVSSIVTEEVA